jgi:hypothetical protein
VWTVTAENVVSPAQKPGSNKRRISEMPLRSINTKRNAAMLTPIRFATRVPVRSLGITNESQYLISVPAIPPILTRPRLFRIELALK